jgi:type IV pilus assembly protein PilV
MACHRFARGPIRPASFERSTLRRTAGVSLIEVLVAMLVVSFGILAMSGLLTNSTRYGKSSEFRAIATLLANDIADRMRANMPGVESNSYVLAEVYAPPSAPPLADEHCTQAAPCTEATGATLAVKDLADWKRALYFGLPGGAGYLSVSADHTAADVWVAWTDPAAIDEERMSDLYDEKRKECPDAFAGNAQPRPRCVYFRVGL